MAIDIPASLTRHRRGTPQPYGNRGRIRCSALVLAAWLCCATLSGCGRGFYPPHELADRITAILANDYHLTARARLAGSTINLVAEQRGLYTNVGTPAVALSEAGITTIGRLAEAVHRVGLSTRPAPAFYAILLVDADHPGAAVIMARRFADVEGANVNLVTPTEFQERSVISFHYEPDTALDMDAFLDLDVNPGMFMANIAASRIQARLRSAMATVAVAPLEYLCDAVFQDGTLTCVITTMPPDAGALLPPPAIQRLFEVALTAIRDTLAAGMAETQRIRVLFPATQALLETTPEGLPTLLDEARSLE